MKQINFPMLLLAFLVVLMFSFAGIAIYYENFWLVLVSLLLGFILMGFGIAQKRARMNNH